MTDGRADRTEDSGASRVPFTQVHQLLRRSLEHAQDVIVVGLAVVLFAVMVRNLVALGQHVLGPALDVREVLGQSLFMMMLIELLRLLVLYLRDHHVAVDVMVETSVVATLREVILRDVVALPPATIAAVALFVITLGLLLRFGDLRARSPGPGHADTTPRSSSTAEGAGAG